jgi:hypothetical protein
MAFPVRPSRPITFPDHLDAFVPPRLRSARLLSRGMPNHETGETPMGIARSGTHCFFTPSQGIADAIGRRDLRPQSGFAPEDFAPFNFRLWTFDFGLPFA